MSLALFRQRLAATPLGGRGMLAASLVCFWAFHFIVLWSSSFSPEGTDRALNLGSDLTWVIAVSCNALALLGCVVALSRGATVHFEKLAQLSGLLTTCGIGLIALRAVWQGVPVGAAFLAGNVLFGVGTGLMMASYADRLRRVSPQTTFMALSAAFTVGALLCLLLTLALVPMARWVAAALLPLLAAYFYGRYAHQADDDKGGAPNATAPALASSADDFPLNGLPLKSLLGLIVVVGLTAGVMRGMSHLDSDVTSAGPLFIGSVLVGGSVLFALSFLVERLRPALLLQGVVVVISAAFMALAFLAGESMSVAFVIHTIGFLFFAALVWLFCTFLGNGRSGGTRLFIIGLCANQMGKALGSLGYLGLVAAVGSSASALVPASLATVYVLLLAALIFFANAGRTRRAVSEVAPQAALQLPLLAEAYHLTAREVEIGVLVAEGKSRAAIAETLVVSQETVKSHTKHLYQKLSVHSRDDLLRLLEEEARQAAEHQVFL